MLQLSRPSFGFGVIDFRDSTKECSILVNPVHICFAFSTKFWYIPTFSTQQKMFDFVRPSSDMFQLSRPSFAFGVFRLSRLNKRVFDFFRLSSNMFRVFYQILICSDFLDPTKNVRFCSTQFRYVSTFSTKFCFWCISTFLTQRKSVRFFSTQFKYVSRFLPNIGIFRLSRLNKKKFDNVQPSSDMLQLSRPSFGFGVF